MTKTIPVLNNDIFETTLTNMCGAMYASTDAIVFGVFKSINSDQVYMNVSIENNDEDYKVYERIYELDKIPENIMELYDYVNSQSYFVFNEDNDHYTLIGDHIGKRAMRKCTIMNLNNNPTKTNELKLVDITKNKIDTDEYNIALNDIYETFSLVKKQTV